MFSKNDHAQDYVSHTGEASPDQVDTVVGSSVVVEGDFVSQGNIIVKGSVSGSVKTSQHLLVEESAKIMANVKARSARIAGEIRGNVKVEETLELTGTAKILGDIECGTLMVEAGAGLSGKCHTLATDFSSLKDTRGEKGNFGTRRKRKEDEMENTLDMEQSTVNV
jgi:cytoskeletal protein CcmA (bactofilin family)